MNRIALAITFFIVPVLAIAGGRQLSFVGIAPVRVGMTIPQAEHALRAKLSMEAPEDSDAIECAIFAIDDRDDPVSYMVERGRITRVDLAGRSMKSSIKTANGVGLGSSIADIKRAYGGRGDWHPNTYDDEPVFEIKSADRKSAILFETERGRVVRIHAGLLRSAEYVEGCW